MMYLTMDAGTMKRVLPRIIYSEGCWEWPGAHTEGYAMVRVSKGNPRRVHRLMYVWMRGPVPAGLELDHLCRNRGCVRPSHLEAVPHAENMRRSPIAHRNKTHCKQGHPFAGENLYLRPGGRGCRVCHREACRRNYAKKKSTERNSRAESTNRIRPVESMNGIRAAESPPRAAGGSHPT